MALQYRWLGLKMAAARRFPIASPAGIIICIFVSPLALFRYPSFSPISLRELIVYACLVIALGAFCGYMFLGLSLIIGRNVRYSFHRLMAVAFYSCVLIAIFSAVLATVFHGVMGIRNVEQFLQARDRCNVDTVEYIATHTRPDAKVFMDFVAAGLPLCEFFAEFGYHLRLFYERGDIELVELDLEEDQGGRQGDYLLYWSNPPQKYPLQTVLEYFGERLRPVTVIETTYIWTNPSIQSAFRPPAGLKISNYNFRWDVFEFSFE
jgi:hypothetical protein